MAADREIVETQPYYAVWRVFKDKEEDQLVAYLLKPSKMCYGLSSEECCTLAYEMATHNQIVIPQSWIEHKKAGIDHFFPAIKIKSLRPPEGCSLSRATYFNKHNVNKFFDNLQNMFQRFPQLLDNGSNIWDLDETGTTTTTYLETSKSSCFKRT